MIGAKCTRTGRVVYNRPKHIFNGRDLVRIVVTVNNNNTANWVNWQAVYHIAFNHYIQVVQKIEKQSFIFDTDEAISEFIAAANRVREALLLLRGIVPFAEELSNLLYYIQNIII